MNTEGKSSLTKKKKKSLSQIFYFGSIACLP